MICAARPFYSDPVCDNGTKDPRTADVVTWHAYWQSRVAEELGLLDLSRALIAVAQRSSPLDKTVGEARQRLGPPPEVECATPPQQPAPTFQPPRPAVFPALLLLLGLLAWALPLWMPGHTCRRWLISLAGLIGTGLVVWLS